MTDFRKLLAHNAWADQRMIDALNGMCSAAEAVHAKYAALLERIKFFRVNL